MRCGPLGMQSFGVLVRAPVAASPLVHPHIQMQTQAAPITAPEPLLSRHAPRALEDAGKQKQRECHIPAPYHAGGRVVSLARPRAPAPVLP